MPGIHVDQVYYDITYGQSVTLMCSVPSVSAPTKVFWTRNGIPIDINDVIYEGSTLNSPSLRIARVTSEYAGTYVCSASNNVGTSHGPSIELAVTGGKLRP